MDRWVAIVLGAALLALALALGILWWLGGAYVALTVLGAAVLCSALKGTPVARAASRLWARLSAVGGRPLVGARAAAAVIGVVGVPTIAATWVVFPVWGARVENEVASVGRVSWHSSGLLAAWEDVCWPVLLAEQAVIVVIVGLLVTWVLRQERRREPKPSEDFVNAAC